jgi:hypothetical protein
MAEYDLAETSRQRAEVSEEIDNVVHALGSMDPVHHAFSQGYADRFNRLGIKDKQLTGMQEIHQMRVSRSAPRAIVSKTACARR